jgi:hypothetical protein
MQRETKQAGCSRRRALSGAEIPSVAAPPHFVRGSNQTSHQDSHIPIQEYAKPKNEPDLPADSSFIVSPVRNGTRGTLPY